MASELYLRDAANSVDATRPKVKPPPQPTSISVPFHYFPSDDGTDENLLILLHGLGPHGLCFFFGGARF